MTEIDGLYFKDIDEDSKEEYAKKICSAISKYLQESIKIMFDMSSYGIMKPMLLEILKTVFAMNMMNIKKYPHAYNEKYETGGIVLPNTERNHNITTTNDNRKIEIMVGNKT